MQLVYSTATADWAQYNTDNIIVKIICLFACLFGFYGISTFLCYLMPNPFLYNKQFLFKQFSLARVHSLNLKSIFISRNLV